MDLDLSKVEAFAGRVLGDFAAASAGLMTNLGHELGLYRALAAGPLSCADLAARAGLHERYVREWLGHQVAFGYVEHDAPTDRYVLPPERAAVLADASSPAFLAAAGAVVSAMFRGEARLRDTFRTGGGTGWHEHDACLFHGTEAFYKTAYRQHLVHEWLPALDGVTARLTRGGRVADVGCGHGASTILMAQAFPASRFVGYDLHEPSIAVARARAEEAGVADRVSFEVAAATTYPARGFDLVCFMDAFHDLGDPALAARHARQALAPDGCALLVEPFASDGAHTDRGTIAALYFAGSTALCTPNALSQGRVALGAQAGPARLAGALREGGFGRVRVAVSTPVNLVIEARP